MDITTEFNKSMKEKESPNLVESFVFQLSTLNEFLKEAYRIVLPPYSSVVPL